jgi:hypothetical protein
MKNGITSNLTKLTKLHSHGKLRLKLWHSPKSENNVFIKSTMEIQQIFQNVSTVCRRYNNIFTNLSLLKVVVILVSKHCLSTAQYKYIHKMQNQ